MALSVAAYARALAQLLPPGAAWGLDPTSTLTGLLRGLAEEAARIDGRGDAAIDESDPRTISELLAEWETVYGLPDPCVTTEQSFGQRRAAVVTKVIARGGQTPAYYIAIAAALGYTVTITEFSPFTVASEVDDPLYDRAWVYAWQVNAPLNTVTYFTVESGVADPLASWGNEALECVLEPLKPAHTLLLFAYT